MGYFSFFFTHSRLFTALYPTLCVKKKIIKKILQITIYEKTKNFTVIVSQIRVLGQQKHTGGAPNTPPPAFIGLISIIHNSERTFYQTLLFLLTGFV